MKLNRTRSLVRPLTLALALTGAPALGLAVSSATAAPAVAAPYCGIHWGSLTRSWARTTTASITDVRSGRHACFDRLVIDLSGTDRRSGYVVKYVSNVRAQGSGAVVPLRGGAKLSITVHAPAYNSTGRPTYTPVKPTELVNTRGYATFRQASWGGSFEGQTTIGLGVRARLPFRVFTLAGAPNGGHGSRLVIDVAHRW
jgi:hypothetical protein